MVSPPDRPCQDVPGNSPVFFRRLNDPSADGARLPDDDQGAKLWNLLPTSVLIALAEGRTLDLGALPPDARAWVAFRAVARERLDATAPTATERLPNGVTGGTLHMTTDSDVVMYGWRAADGEPAMPLVLDADGYGRRQAVGDEYRELPASAYVGWDRFRVGTVRSRTLRFEFAPRAVMTLGMQEVILSPGPPARSLPAAFLAAAEKSRLTTRPVVPPKTDPPPPR